MLSCKHGFHFQRRWSNFDRHFKHLLFEVTVKNLSNLYWLIIWYLNTSLVCLCGVVLPCVAWRNCVINFTVLLCIIFMHMFYRVMKVIYQFAANLLSYIPTKYYWNRSTSDLVIVKSKRVNFFETQCSVIQAACSVYAVHAGCIWSYLRSRCSKCDDTLRVDALHAILLYRSIANAY